MAARATHAPNPVFHGPSYDWGVHPIDTRVDVHEPRVTARGVRFSIRMNP
jgi:hypothetical protein